MKGVAGNRLPVAGYPLPVTAGGHVLPNRERGVASPWKLVTGNRQLSRLPAARLAVATGFFLSGLGFASWVVRIPEVQAGLGLSKGVLGLVLLGVAAGALVAMPLSGALIARWGSRRVLRAAALAFALSVALPPLAPGAWTLGLCLVLLGGSNSVMSVAMNTQAAAIERRYRRPIMASFHALYSFGGLAGATLGGLMAGAGVAPGPHLVALALAIAAAALLVAPATLPHVLEGGGGGRSFARPTRRLLVLGAVAFCVLFGEGAAADWSAVYLRDAVGTGPGLAAAGFAAFSLMMATGRLLGDSLTLRLGPVTLVRAGGLAAAAGIATAVALPLAPAAILGFGAVGAGLSTIFPTVLAAAGRSRDNPPATAIAAVSSLGYTGFLAGPPLIGLVAESASLRLGVGLVGATSLLIVALAGRLGRG